MDNVLAFLTGSAATLLGTWLSHRWTEKRSARTREADYVREQLQRVYGHLQYLTSLNRLLFDHRDAIRNAAREEFTPEQLREYHGKQQTEDMQHTQDKQNEYSDLMRSNEDEAMRLLRENYAYVDTDDMEVFEQFTLESTRIKIEFEANTPLPLEVQERLPVPCYMRPELIDRIQTKFLTKQKRLKQLGG